MRVVALAIILVTFFIWGCSYWGSIIHTPHHVNGVAEQWAMFSGVASAMCWAWSSVSGLFTGTLAVIRSPMFNSWLNFFAAAFAAFAVGLGA